MRQKMDVDGKQEGRQGTRPFGALRQEKERAYLLTRTQERHRIVSVLSCVLEQLFSSKDDKLPEDPSKITMFHTQKPPPISISAYFHRIAKYSDCSGECLILALVHINRILHTRPHFYVNALNIHRLLLTSVMCSAKFFDDQYFNNAYYSKIGGVSNRELNCLEVEFLALVNFDLHVPGESYAQFYTQLANTSLHSECRCVCSPVNLTGAGAAAEEDVEDFQRASVPQALSSKPLPTDAWEFWQEVSEPYNAAHHPEDQCSDKHPHHDLPDLDTLSDEYWNESDSEQSDHSDTDEVKHVDRSSVAPVAPTIRICASSVLTEEEPHSAVDESTDSSGESSSGEEGSESEEVDADEDDVPMFGIARPVISTSDSSDSVASDFWEADVRVRRHKELLSDCQEKMNSFSSQQDLAAALAM